MSDQVATCPECARTIIVENGRFTVHSNPRRKDGRYIPRCTMSERRVGLDFKP